MDKMNNSRPAIATFVCPNCQGKLNEVNSDRLRCNQCSSIYFCQNDIPLFLSKDATESLISSGERSDSPLNGREGDREKTSNFAAPTDVLDWENLYRQVDEPWSYSTRAAEILKYRYLLKTSSQILSSISKPPLEHPISGTVIDVGCSFGRLSTDLALKGAAVTALDISPTAMYRAKELCEGERFSPKFGVASCTALPVASGVADLVIVADGLYSYKISMEDCRIALLEANRVLKSGGKILLMDYMKPERFDSFVDLVKGNGKGNGFQIDEVHLLYDRLFYALEMGLKVFHDRNWCRWLLANIPLAHLLSLGARLLGKTGSSHICVIATKVEIIPESF